MHGNRVPQYLEEKNYLIIFVSLRLFEIIPETIQFSKQLLSLSPVPVTVLGAEETICSRGRQMNRQKFRCPKINDIMGIIIQICGNSKEQCSL